MNKTVKSLANLLDYFTKFRLLMEKEHPGLTEEELILLWSEHFSRRFLKGAKA